MKAARFALSISYLAVMAVISWQSYHSPAYQYLGTGQVWLASILGVGLLLLWRQQRITKFGWGFAAAVIVVASLSYANTSRDWLRYLFDGELIRLWHLSPYVHLPGEFPADLYVRAMNSIWWMKIPSPYGPVWQATMALVNLLTGNSLVGGLILLKLLNMAALILAAKYLYGVTHKAWVSFLFLTNPVILLNSVATPHTDLVLAAGLLGALYYRDRPMSGALLPTTSFIKMHSLLFAPFLPRNWRQAANLTLSMAGVMMLWLLVGLPLLHSQTGEFLRAQQSGASAGDVSQIMRTFWPNAPLSQVTLMSYVLGALMYAGLLIAYFRQRITQTTAIIGVSLIVPFMLTGLLLPWHFIIPIACLFLSPRREAWWMVMFVTLLVLRSATTAVELLALMAVCALGGAAVYYVGRRIIRPPAVLRQLASAVWPAE